MLTDKYNIAALLNEKGKLFADCSESFLLEQAIKPAGRYTTALNFQQQALQLAKETKSHSLTAQILEDISTTYEKVFGFFKGIKFL